MSDLRRNRENAPRLTDSASMYTLSIVLGTIRRISAWGGLLLFLLSMAILFISGTHLVPLTVIALGLIPAAIMAGVLERLVVRFAGLD